MRLKFDLKINNYNNYKNMNQIIKPESIDFNDLVYNNSNKISLDCQSKMVSILNKEFTEEENRWYIANLYIYMNYHSTNDFPINLDTLITLVGFANKQNAKRTLINNFIEDEDYTILLIPKDVNKETRGRMEEKVMLNIDTFKNMCMLVKTEKSKEIRRYYVKLENIYNKIVVEEIEINQKLLEQRDKLHQIELLENKQLIDEKNEQIKQLEMKPDTEGFLTNNGHNYVIKDKSNPGSYKIGYGDPDKRACMLNVGSSQKSLVILYTFETKNMRWSEKITHIMLESFKIKKRNEWFYLPTDLELNYAIYTIKNIIEYTDKYNFIDYNEFKRYSENIPNLLDTEFKKPEVFKNTSSINKEDKISKYNGVTFSIENNKWITRLNNNNQCISLGCYETEIEAAIIYNDYASYINETEEIKYKLNQIDNYISNPRDIVKEREGIKLESKTSIYHGVYYIKSKQIFECGVRYKKKSFKIFKSTDEFECAKIYNEQALYFNNHLGTKYKLNDIEGLIEKNHIHDLEVNKFKKYSRFTGVSIRKDTNKFRSYIKHLGKVIHLGSFVDEIDCAKAYNKKAEELNLLEITKIKYTLNVFDEDE